MDYRKRMYRLVDIFEPFSNHYWGFKSYMNQVKQPLFEELDHPSMDLT
jgi:hypothetical protein